MPVSTQPMVFGTAGEQGVEWSLPRDILACETSKATLVKTVDHPWVC